MSDARGWRGKFGCLAPSTNTIVQPDYDDLRVPGVTAHYSRILVRNMAVGSNEGFAALTDAISASVDAALDSVLTSEPDRIVMGMSAISFYGGVAGAEAFAARIGALARLPVNTGALATAAALRRFGVRRVAFFSPYFPNANAEVRRFYAECGFEVVADECLRCESPVAIAHVPVARCREVVLRLDGHAPDAIVQVGTNLSMLDFAASAEAVLGKPVIAINAATWWQALREHGVDDRIVGKGRLLGDH
ncbi:maleate cis-trans isomerase family protein [Sandaracinobacteroides saxicola]|uniref:Arylmalonate decarboxylase n=1 Tax=Sandaracinobacteroides saxicola TaxID=2759707 RepID=A0A7G5IG13_9SPHN|nr:arylmalonate decarboxylase [Sandaracinobacteroides saxicola]QMW22305.1 arylmalonate decarboxylase [Sandaracinobacteroides saxicola]